MTQPQPEPPQPDLSDSLMLLSEELSQSQGERLYYKSLTRTLERQLAQAQARIAELEGELPPTQPEPTQQQPEE